MRRKQIVFFSVLVAVLSATIALAGLARLYRYNKNTHVSFSDWVAVEHVSGKNNEFRFGIACMVSAEETWVTYKGFIDYVANGLGNEASMILRPSYSDVRTLLEEKRIDSALICTGTYVMCSRASTVELIAVPEFKNDREYRCLFVVGENSPINNIADLRGRSFAFTDPESNTGCIVPSWAICKQGYKRETFFGRVIYTGSHDRSLHAVAQGIVDGAAVDSLVFYSFVENHPEMKDCLRIIWKSKPFGAPPVVAPTGLSESMKAQLRETLLSMSQDVRGREILNAIGIERFRTPQPGEYDSACEIWDSIRKQE